MTEISFHFNAPDKVAYACRFARKALRRDRTLVIRVPDPLLDELDQLLWNMAPHDFVAHCRASDTADVLQFSPIVLTADGVALPHHDLLLNLDESVPVDFGSFTEVVEVVGVDNTAGLEAARSRWRYYRERGYALTRHDLLPRSR